LRRAPVIKIIDVEPWIHNARATCVRAERPVSNTVTILFNAVMGQTAH